MLGVQWKCDIHPPQTDREAGMLALRLDLTNSGRIDWNDLRRWLHETTALLSNIRDGMAIGDHGETPSCLLVDASFT